MLRCIVQAALPMHQYGKTPPQRGAANVSALLAVLGQEAFDGHPTPHLSMHGQLQYLHANPEISALFRQLSPLTNRAALNLFRNVEGIRRTRLAQQGRAFCHELLPPGHLLRLTAPTALRIFARIQCWFIRLSLVA
jgi:hypothetical protein